MCVGALLIVVCSLFAVAKLVEGIVRGPRGEDATRLEVGRWWLEDVLVLAMAGSAVTFVVLAVNGVPGARYLVATVVFASVLSGRVVARAWQHLRPGPISRVSCVAGAAASLCFAAGLGCTLAQPAAAQSVLAAVSWLEVHHLRNGLGGYWASSITDCREQGCCHRAAGVGGPGRQARPVHEAVFSHLVCR